MEQHKPNRAANWHAEADHLTTNQPCAACGFDTICCISFTDEGTTAKELPLCSICQENIYSAVRWAQRD